MSAGRGGILECKEVSPFMIRIGFHKVPIVNKNKGLLQVKGKLIFKGSAHLGSGSRIVVSKGAVCNLGHNFAISASSYIYCYKYIKVGNDVQLSWDDLLMDSDSHRIYDTEGKQINSNKEIIIGDKVWIGCDCKILRGSVIPSHCVVGANSVVTSSELREKTLVLGQPAKSVKDIQGWEL